MQMVVLRVVYDARRAVPYAVQYGKSVLRATDYTELWLQMRDHLRVHGEECTLQFSTGVRLSASERSALESIVAYHNHAASVRTGRKN